MHVNDLFFLRAEAKEFYDSILAEYDAMVATKTQEYDSLVENGNALIEQQSQNLASLLGTRRSDATQNARFEGQLGKKFYTTHELSKNLNLKLIFSFI